MTSKDDSPLITVDEFCKRYTWPSKGALRMYINHRKKNGLAKAFYKFGKRVVIDDKEFFRIIRENQKD